MLDDWIPLAILVISAIAGRSIAKLGADGTAPTMLTFLGGSMGAAFGFLMGICIMPPLVVDPLLVFAQLPALGAVVGAIVESLALAIRFCMKRSGRKPVVRDLLMVLLIGGLSYAWLVYYNSPSDQRLHLDGPTAVPISSDEKQ